MVKLSDFRSLNRKNEDVMKNQNGITRYDSIRTSDNLIKASQKTFETLLA